MNVHIFNDITLLIIAIFPDQMKFTCHSLQTANGPPHRALKSSTTAQLFPEHCCISECYSTLYKSTGMNGSMENDKNGSKQFFSPMPNDISPFHVHLEIHPVDSAD